MAQEYMAQNALLVLAIVLLIYFFLPSPPGRPEEASAVRGAAGSFRSSSMEENKKRYGATVAPGAELSESADRVPSTEWPRSSAPAEGDVFSWNPPAECDLSSFKGVSKAGAMRGANNSPMRLSNWEMDSYRAKARIMGNNPIAALRPQEKIVLHKTPIVFNDSGMRQVYINQRTGCFDKGEDLSACHFSSCS